MNMQKISYSGFIIIAGIIIIIGLFFLAVYSNKGILVVSYDVNLNTFIPCFSITSTDQMSLTLEKSANFIVGAQQGQNDLIFVHPINKSEQ